MKYGWKCRLLVSRSKSRKHLLATGPKAPSILLTMGIPTVTIQAYIVTKSATMGSSMGTLSQRVGVWCKSGGRKAQNSPRSGPLEQISRAGRLAPLQADEQFRIGKKRSDL